MPFGKIIKLLGFTTGHWYKLKKAVHLELKPVVS